MMIRMLSKEIDPGRGYGEKKGRGEPSKAPCRLEGRAIKSAEWPDQPPNSACTKAQAEGESLESLKGKTRDGVSAGLSAEEM